MTAAKKIILALWVVVLGVAIAPANVPRALENRTWEKIAPALELHQDFALQAAEPHQDEKPWRFQLASDPPIDADGRFGKAAYRAADDFNLGTRALGAGQGILGGAGAFGAYTGAVATSPTVVGGVGLAALGTLSVDASQAGFRTMWTGNYTPTMLNSSARAMGATPGQAAAVEIGVAVAVSGGTALATNGSRTMAALTNTTALSRETSIAANATVRAESSLSGQLLRNQLAGQEIAGGHAFAKHAGEFGFTNPGQMAAHVESVMTNPSAMRNLSGGRTAFWDNATQSVVIRNPSAVDGGTTFIPKNGINYFLNELH